MKKIIFGIFAHPDDEAFGPSGTLLMETKAGNEVHLISLTAGEAGCNPDNHDDLAAVRLEEWKKAGSLIGASSMTCLGYKDGKLSNESMIEIGQKLIDHIAERVSTAPADVSIELMSTDLNGISGHIDHIVAGRASCFAFFSLKQHDERFSRIRLACVSRERLPESNVNWLYMEAGRAAKEIDETVDARQWQANIIEIMACHHTQRADYQTHIDRGREFIGLNHFIVLS